MALLHTVNKSPFESNTFDTCLSLAKDGSTILLIEDGVYAATTGTGVAEKIKNKVTIPSDKEIVLVFILLFYKCLL